MKAFSEMPDGMKLVLASIILVFVLAAASVPFVALTGIGEGGGNSTAEAVIEKVLQTGSNTGADVTLRKLPKDLPTDAPRYPNGKLLAGVRTISQEGLGFILLYQTKESPSKAMEYFERALDTSKWQIAGLTRSEEGSSLQYVRSDGTVSGSITIARFGREGGGDERPWDIAVSYFNASLGEAAPSLDDAPFDLTNSFIVPAGYPNDRVPVYSGATIIGSSFFEQQSGTIYLLLLVTPDSQEDVIDFYSQRLARAGWTVERPVESASSIELDFADPLDDTFGGTITAAVFLRQTRMTEIELRFALPN